MEALVASRSALTDGGTGVDAYLQRQRREEHLASGQTSERQEEPRWRCEEPAERNEKESEQSQ